MFPLVLFTVGVVFTSLYILYILIRVALGPQDLLSIMLRGGARRPPRIGRE